MAVGQARQQVERFVALRDKKRIGHESKSPESKGTRKTGEFLSRIIVKQIDDWFSVARSWFVVQLLEFRSSRLAFESTGSERCERSFSYPQFHTGARTFLTPLP